MNKLVLKTKKSTQIVDELDVIRLESDSNYTTVFLTNGKKITISKSLKTFDELLSESVFLRVHQSHLVNTTYIEKYEVKYNKNFIKLKDKSIIPVSKRKVSVVFNFFNSLNTKKSQTNSN